MTFQEVFLCSPQNAECLDSPPRVAAAEASISLAAAAAPGDENGEEEQLPHVQVQVQPQKSHEEDGGILRRSRARMEERAQFLKECEMMIVKTASTKKKLLGPQLLPPTTTSTTSTPEGSFAISMRMKKLWDFNDTAGDDVDEIKDNVAPPELQQQRDDEDHDDDIDTNYYHYNNIQDINDDDDDDIEMLWPSTKIRRESRRAKLGMQTMREKQELSEVESFVAEMRRKRMVREEERQKNCSQDQERDDGWREFDKMLINEEEKDRKHEIDDVEQEHARKIVPYDGINREDDDDLEEYTAIRTMEAVQSSPRDARLQRICKWKNANSTQYHQKTTTTSTTLARRSSSSSSYAIHNSSAEEVGTLKGPFVKKETHARLTDSELKRWWNEHKRDNHIEHSMPSFDELVDEPTILEKRTPKQSPERELSTTSMRIEHLRNSRKGGRADHPPHPEDSSTTPNNNDRLAPSEKASTSLLLPPPPPPPKLSLSNIGSSIVTEHHHTIDEYDTMSHSTLAILQSRLDEAKVKFAKVTAEATKHPSPSLNRQKDVNNLEEQAALAELISRLGEAVVTMKKLDQI